jgi:ubiquinone/menaquinone biosynthesis C-methylase UbiE
MELSNTTNTHKVAEPQAPDWASVSLAETWPDSLDLSSWRGWRELMRAFFGKQRRAVELPSSYFALSNVPKYILQEFHNLPNGNYSRRFSRGYITGFDVAMLGHMQRARTWVAAHLQGCNAVLDVGTAGGRTAAILKQQGAEKVWGIDPSPYLLQHAASDYPGIVFVPGLAEDLPFTDNRLDGISLCFVLHEMPPKYIKQALAEFYRVLQSGGKLVIAEPSPRQLEPLQWRFLFSRAGWSQMYFKFLAHRVYEPFLSAWHKLDKPQLLQDAGFRLVEDRSGMPINFWVAEKPAT